MYKQVVFPILERFDAETTHERILTMLTIAGKSITAQWLMQRLFSFEDRRLNVDLFGLHFRNPLGLAAGFDKNAAAARALASLGFGHIEAGTIIPLAQPGNPRPRIFRLGEDQGLINRMSFPGRGMLVAKKNLRGLEARDFILGVNIGANKVSVEDGRAVEDYEYLTAELAKYCDYITINVSSPNTARLRDLQGKEALAHLIDQVLAARDQKDIRRPILVKIAPDLGWPEINDILDVVTSREVDGIIATNTTTQRFPNLKSPNKSEEGGLSGRPLTALSTAVVRYIYRCTEGRLPIVGVGGIFTAEDALEKIKAGASLVQTYTGFIYEGPTMAKRVNKGIVDFLDREGLSSIQQLVGSET